MSAADTSRRGDLPALLDSAQVLLCCGTGGVGKTTVAAALGKAAAEQGRKVVVVTIDPARRLADALGLADIGNESVQIELPSHDGEGELWATMLDTKATFDELIGVYAADAQQADRILTNRYYRNLSEALSGTREYMAMEKLYQLHQDERFDLVVVDTPPSRNALDFLDAPDRLNRFLDGRLFRLANPGRKFVKTLTAPVMTFMRRVARVVSPEVVDDVLAFIEAFGGMEDGFRQRATAVEELLAHEGTGFVVITSAAQDAVDESVFFAQRLAEASQTVAAVVANRLHPRFTEQTVEELEARAARVKNPVAQSHYRALIDLTRLADTEAGQLDQLLDTCPTAAVARVDLLDHDIHDLDGIAEIQAALLK